MTAAGRGWDGRTVYKIVEPAVAPLVTQGSLRVGTFRSYAALEGDRRDTAENATHTHVADLTITRDNNPFKGYFSIDGPGDIEIENSTITVSGPNMYCFCTTYDPSAAKSDDAIFEIADLAGLAMALTHRYQKLGHQIAIGLVEYAPRRTSFGNGLQIYPSPFIKDEQFAWEKEARICWPNPVRSAPPVYSPGISYDPAGYDLWKAEMREEGLSRFDTAADAQIASYIKRIR